MLNTFPINRLLFGDDLGWLRHTKEFPDASVDLEYLAPPFNSNADYKVLFREVPGEASQAQFQAFTDTWSWAAAAEAYYQFIDTIEGLLDNTERVDVPPQTNPFAKAQREAKPQKQTDRI